MFNVRLAGGHLYGKQLFTWLSLVVSLMASFVLSFFPLDVLDGIWDLIESVSEGFHTYSFSVSTICESVWASNTRTEPVRDPHDDFQNSQVSKREPLECAQDLCGYRTVHFATYRKKPVRG